MSKPNSALYVAWLRGNTCPECGTPLDEVPLTSCKTHEEAEISVEYYGEGIIYESSEDIY